MRRKGLIIAGAIALIVIIVLLVRREKNVNVYDYPQTLVVNNYTKHKNAETYSKIILNKIYHYDTVNLNVYYTSRDYGTDEIEVLGFIQKNPYEAHSYNIFVKKGSLPISVKKFLSHELIHLHQMEIGDLVPIQSNSMIVYKGDTIVYRDMEYNDRPHEIDALQTQDKIFRELNRLLYSKNR